MKRLLFIISNFNIGGPQKSLLALFDLIDYSKFEVDLIILSQKGALLSHINKHVRIIQIDEIITAFTFPVHSLLKTLKVLLVRGGISLFLSALIELAKTQIKRETVVVMRQRFWEKNKKYLPKYNKQYDAAFSILGLSTYYMVDCVEANKLYHWIRSDVRVLQRDKQIDESYYRLCTGFISVSNMCAKIFSDEYGINTDKIRTFYNFIPESFYNTIDCDTDLMKKDNSHCRILTVCRLDPYKGLEMAMDACSILRDKGYDFCWYVLGDGEYRKTIEEMIIEKNIRDRFILLGFQMNTIAFIREADIIVHPSRFEGKSNAVDEALFCEKPTIVTNYPTAKEVINNGVNGIICEMSSIGIANAIEMVFLDEMVAKRIKEGCRINKSTRENPNEVLLTLC